MTPYFKAIRPDGTSFHDPSFRWVPESGDPTGTVVTHPNFSATGEASGYLSVSTEPGDCTGVGWPCRLLTVEPVGEVLPDPRGEYPHKRIGASFRVTGERPAYEALGPNGAQVAAFLALHKPIDIKGIDDPLCIAEECDHDGDMCERVYPYYIEMNVHVVAYPCPTVITIGSL